VIKGKPLSPLQGIYQPSRETSTGCLSLATGNITLRPTLHIMSKCCAWTESGPKNVPGPNRSNIGPAGTIPGTGVTGPTRRLVFLHNSARISGKTDRIFMKMLSHTYLQTRKSPRKTGFILVELCTLCMLLLHSVVFLWSFPVQTSDSKTVKCTALHLSCMHLQPNNFSRLYFKKLLTHSALCDLHLSAS